MRGGGRLRGSHQRSTIKPEGKTGSEELGGGKEKESWGIWPMLKYFAKGGGGGGGNLSAVRSAANRTDPFAKGRGKEERVGRENMGK